MLLDVSLWLKANLSGSVDLIHPKIDAVAAMLNDVSLDKIREEVRYLRYSRIQLSSAIGNEKDTSF